MRKDINFDKFNPKAIHSIELAYDIARTKNQNPVEASHLLFSLLNQKDAGIENFILSTGNTIESIKILTQKQVIDVLKLEKGFLAASDMHMSSSLSAIFQQAQANMEEMGDAYVRPEHLLLAISQSNDPIKNMLSTKGISSDKILKHIQSMKSEGKSEPINFQDIQNESEQSEDLSLTYGEDITKIATEGLLDKVFFRDEEVNNIIQILMRSYTNNVIVVGEPGSGKTSLVHALAQKISDKEVPESLQDVKILSLDIGKLSLGNKYGGDLEKKLKAIFSQTENSAGKTLLFIDDFQNLIEVFKSQSTSDLGILLKSFLSKGNFKIIGTTDIASYNNAIQTNSLLSKIFQKVEVEATNVEDTTTILRYQKNKLENNHAVSIAEDAVTYSVQFADRYIFDREFPDKAIALLDEATSRKELHMLSMPDSLLKIRQNLLRLDSEKNALSVENDSNNTSKIEELTTKIQTLNEQYALGLSNREQNKQLFKKIQTLYRQIFALKKELALPSVSDKTTKENLILGFMNEIATMRKSFKNVLGLDIQDQVTRDDVGGVVALKTGIPIDKINKTESQKLLELETTLSSKVIGQDKAVSALSNAVRRARSGLSDPKKPIGSFIFLGSTGVGKTELAKSLAEILFDDEKFLIRIDMSEYQEKHSVSRLIGSPPGYVGYDQGGQLTEAVKEKPYSVILFDEIEKADPDVFKILLQVLDDGRLTDGKGRTISFKNTIIIMTSNIGGDAIIQTFDEIKADKEKIAEQTSETKEETPKQSPEEKIKELEDRLKESVKAKSSPEFVNRIDEFIMFNPITKEMIAKILDIHLRKFTSLVSKEKNMTLLVSDQAKEFLGIKGRDPAMGARPVKRAIQDYIANPLSREIISGTFGEGDSIIVTIENDNIVFQKSV